MTTTLHAETPAAADIVSSARTALFVPGDRPERYSKAAASGADVVIIDLEDAVAPAAKDQARASAVSALTPAADPPLRALVRVNAVGTATHDAEITDLLALASRPGSGLLGVVVPKAEDPSVIAGVVQQFRGTGSDVAVVALIESAVGVVNAVQIAGVDGVTRLALGAIDLTVDVGADLDSPLVTYAAAQLVLASRAARIAPPLDSPCTAINDPVVVELSARAAAATGFGGKLCIHPSQLRSVLAAFVPSDEQIAWARSVIAAGDAAVQIDGQMIDKPVIDKARAILRRAGQDPS